MRFSARVGLVVLPVAIGCAPSAPTLPDAPMAQEMDELTAVYEHPTGTVDVAAAQQTLAAIDARLPDLRLDWMPDLIAEALIRLWRRIADVGLAEEEDADAPSEHTDIDAVVELHRVCKGWSDPAGLPDEAANGSLELTGVVEDGVLRQDMWGSATACKTRLDPLDGPLDLVVTPSPSANLSLDGSLNVRLYGPLPRSVPEAKFLLLFSGRLGTDDRTTETSLDFRVLDGHFDFRYAVSDGDIVVEVGLTSVSLRGSNGTFTCDLASRSCQ